MMRVVDFSEWQRLPSQAWFDGLRPEHGVAGVVIQAWGGGPISGRRNEYYSRVLGRARGAGLRCAAYIWPAEDVVLGLGWIGQSEPDWVGLDYESGSRPNDGQYRRVRESGHKPVTYTFPSYWRHDLGNTHNYAYTDLWLSRGYYSNNHPKRPTVWWPGDGNTVPYDPFGSFAGQLGGWTEAIGWQFQGTTSLRSGGETVGVDLNVFQRWPRPVGTEEPEPKARREEPMKLVQTDQGRSTVWLLRGGLRQVIANPQTLATIRYLMALDGWPTETKPINHDFLMRTTQGGQQINLVGWNPDG